VILFLKTDELNLLYYVVNTCNFLNDLVEFYENCCSSFDFKVASV